MSIGACWVSLWTPGSPKWSLRERKKGTQGLQDVSFEYKKWSISDSACLQVSVDRGGGLRQERPTHICSILDHVSTWPSCYFMFVFLYYPCLHTIGSLILEPKNFNIIAVLLRQCSESSRLKNKGPQKQIWYSECKSRCFVTLTQLHHIPPIRPFGHSIRSVRPAVGISW